MVNIEPVLYIGTTQSFFAGLLIATKKPTTTANRVMAAWLFMICIEMIFALLNSKVIEMYSFPFITFTYGPLLYLYISFMTTPGRKFNPVELIHFVPFVVFFTVSVVFRSEPLVRDLRVSLNLISSCPLEWFTRFHFFFQLQHTVFCRS